MIGDAARQRRVALVATTGPEVTGGLAAYSRELVAATARDVSWTIVARFSTDRRDALLHHAHQARSAQVLHGSPVYTVAPSTRALPMLRIGSRLIHRPATQSLAVRIFAARWGDALERALPRDVELIHVVGAGWEMMGFAALAVARARKIPVTIWPALHVGEWGDGPVDARLYRKVDRIFAQSEPERRRYLQLGVDDRRIVVTGLAPACRDDGDARRFRERHALGESPIAFFLGRKSPEKGFDATCAAMATVRARLPQARLVVLGDAGLSKIDRVAAGILELPVLDEQQKADALAAADVMCLPSRSEAFGIAYTEAWKYGTPVIAGPALPVRELVEDGVTGLFTTQRPQDIADALLIVLCDPALAKRLGAAGRVLQQARYTWPRVARTHVNAFDAAVDGVAEPAARSGTVTADSR